MQHGHPECPPKIVGGWGAAWKVALVYPFWPYLCGAGVGGKGWVMRGKTGVKG